VDPIGERIRKARKAAGLTQEDLAQGAGVRLNAIARLERGESRDPHYSTLRGIARTVGVPIEDLVREGEYPGPLALV
jgi:transcriptional regulator with XRE-family HTH domain